MIPLRSIMAGEFARTEMAPSGKFKAIMAGLEGNHHLVGCRMVSNAIELNGREVMFPGTNTRTRSHLDRVLDTQPHLAVISAKLPCRPRAAKKAVGVIGETLGRSASAAMIGGLSIDQCGGVAGSACADAYGTDATGAVLAAESLVSA